MSSKRPRPAAEAGGEEDFPRGAPLSANEPASGAKGAKKRDKKPKAIALERFDEQEDKSELGVKGKLQSYAPFLKYKSLTVGMKVWGRVSDIGDQQLTVSLPAGLKGTVKLAEASDEFKKLANSARKPKKPKTPDAKKRRLSDSAAAAAAAAGGDDDDSDAAGSSSDEEDDAAAEAAAAAPEAEAARVTLRDAFSVGQLVWASVIKVSKGDAPSKEGKGKHIALSLRLSRIVGGMKIGSVAQGDLLLATVTSVEDHGYLLSFGPNDFTGFLLFKECTDDKGALRSLSKGAQLRVSVTSVDKPNKSVRVSAQQRELKAAVSGETSSLTFNALLPGMLVNARVRAVLSDGLLLTFLTYFTGTVDLLSMEDPLQTAGQLASSFVENQRLRARILYVDPTNKRVGLTLSKPLVQLSDPPRLPPVGTVVENAVVRRLDTAVGLLCELKGDAAGSGAAGYAHISQLSDSRVEKLEKAFKRGQKVRARVIGHRLMDGLASLTLKPSVLDQAYLSFEEISPGAVATGKIASIEPHGLYVTLGERLRVLVPASHISESGTAKLTSKRYKVGTPVTCRILSVDTSARRARATLKRTLVESRLPPLAQASDAAPGAVAHGVITGVQPYGCFVEFFGKVKGMAHKTHLGLLPDEDPTQCFESGQVVKCTVIGPDSSGRGIRVSFSKAAGAGGEASAAAGADGERKEKGKGGGEAGSAFAAGRVVPKATVKSVNEAGGILEVALPGGEAAVLEAAHLSDSADVAKQLMEVMHEGAELGPLLLLEHLGKRKAWRATRKAALLAAAASGSFPKALGDLKKGALVAGFVANATAAGVFVRFGGRLTALAPLSQVGEGFVSNPQEMFSIGQTVRAQVLSVDEAVSKAVLSLKPPPGLSDEGAPFLASLLKDLQWLDELTAKKEGSARWSADFPVGSVVKGAVSEEKDFGLVVDLPDHPDVVALISSGQAEGADLSAGSKVKACVLDVSEAAGVVDLGVRDGLLESVGGHAGKKKGATPGKAGKADAGGAAAGAKVKCVVECVKAPYLVLSVPALGCLALAQAWAFNAPANPLEDAQRKFEVGQKVSGVVAVAAADEPTRGVMLVTVKQPSKAEREDAEAEKAGGDAAQDATVTKVGPAEAFVRLANGREGRLHVTQFPPLEGKAAAKAGGANPLARLKAGASVRVRSVGLARSLPSAADGKSFLELVPEEADPMAPARAVAFDSIVVGQKLTGYVVDTHPECIWVGFTPNLKARLDALDCGLSFPELASLANSKGAALAGTRLAPGQPVTVVVTDVDRERHHLDVAAEEEPKDIEEGALVPGRVSRTVAGTGLIVDLGHGRSGRVALTAIRDAYTDAIAESVKPGTFVFARVARVDGGKIDLSLRACRGGCEGKGVVPEKPPRGYKPVNPEVKNYGQLQPGMEVTGFVKATSKKGCFVTLGEGVDARVLLSNLSDTFVADPAKAFPPGKLVRGTVISVDAGKGRADVSLRSDASTAASTRGLADLKVGEVVHGTVRKVETFGVFVTVDGCAASGLCHISEVADERIKSLPARVSVGERVKAVVLRVDPENKKLSLGMKPSYFGEEKAGKDAGKKRARPEEDLLVDKDEEEEEEEEEGEDVAMEDAAGGSEEEAEEDESEEDDDDDDEEDEDEEEEEEEEEPPARKKAKAAAAAPSAAKQSAALRTLLADVAGVSDPSAAAADDAAFDWEVAPRDALGGDDDDAPSTTAAKKSKRQKQREKEERERTVRERELALADGTDAPASADDFERRIMASPNSSFLWIRFMAFQISLGEIDEARAVAERALEQINYREENELFNVWVAYLNLENMHGEPREDAVLRVLQRARARCDEKKLLLALAGIYERTAHPEDAEKTLSSACRKFSQSCKVWLRRAAFDLTSSSAGDAKHGSASTSATVDRAVKALPARKHVKFLTQAALLEFRSGSAERARTLFEGVLQAHPRRMDLWSVYIDQEVKLGEQQRVRALMERAVHTDQPAKKMKFLFKRYLQYEVEHGDDASVAHVRKLAAEFVESKGGGAI